MRPLESLGRVDDGRSSKRRRLTPKDSEKLDQLKAEIGDIKAQTMDIKAQMSDIKAETEYIKVCISEISEHLREDADYKLCEIIHSIRRLSEL